LFGKVLGGRSLGCFCGSIEGRKKLDKSFAGAGKDVTFATLKRWT